MKVLVYYVDIDQMTKVAARKHMKKVVKTMRKVMGKKKRLIVVPRRSGESELGVLHI